MTLQTRCVALMALGLLSWQGHARAATAAADAVSNEAPSNHQLNTAIVEAQRIKQLETQIRHFTSSVLVQPFKESLLRWDVPICPLVAGFPRDRGEYVLVTVSQIARESRAPLAGEKYDANLFIIVTRQPDLLLKLWWDRDPILFDTRYGVGEVKSFLKSPRPVRVWYNFDFACGTDCTSAGPSPAPALLGSTALSGLQFNIPVFGSYSGGSRLSLSAVRGLYGVIIVVDANQIAKVNMQQLADYVGMIGLADVRLGADTGSTPSILNLFRSKTDQAPRGMSAWDRALLYGLYTTTQAQVMQASAIKSTMLKQLLQ